MTRIMIQAHLLVLQAAATWFMFGLILFVQIVHYPLLKNVGEDRFVTYESIHVRKTTLVVGLPMLVELFTASAMCFVRPVEVSAAMAYLGAALLAIAWISSWTLQVPMHKKLCGGFREDAWRILVRSNWIRTIAWGCRSLLLSYWIAQFFPPT